MQTETLQELKEKALKEYPNATTKGKTLLEKIFGRKAFQGSVIDRVKTFEDACEELNIEPEDVLHSAHSDYLKENIASINAFAKLQVIARALNEGWQPDWDNRNEYKYYPWFEMSPSGFRYDVCDFVYTYSNVGSRLCFKSAELAKYAGQQFLSLYKDFLTI